MRRIIFIIIVVVIALTSCKLITSNRVEISGKILDNSPALIEYTLPLDGISYFGFKESVNPDSLGNFKISLEIEKPSFMEFFTGFDSYGALIIEPGNEYEILIDTKTKGNAFTVKCKDEEGQKLYNKIKNRNMIDGHFELEAREFITSADPDNIKQTLNTRKEDEIAGFTELFNRKAITKGFYDLVKSDREYFYTGALGSIAFINYLYSERGRNALNKEQYESMWKEVFQNRPVSDPEIRSSQWFFYYIQNYLWYQQLIIESFDKEKNDSINKMGITHTFQIESAKKYLNGPSLEYYTAAYIYYEAINRNYEKEFISLFNEYKKDYPDSKYTKYLTPLVDEVAEFHEKLEKGFNEKSIFIDNYLAFDSLKECLQKIAGKKLYIDTWASWCGPCKEEFKHNPELRKLLDSKNMNILYISIDSDRDDQKWKDMIKFYDLEGYHIRANTEMTKDLRRIFGPEGRFGIPWYVLADEKGNIVVNHAKPPSQIKELEKQIDEVFSKK